MNRNGPVILIEDDMDDQEILMDVFKKLQYPNEMICFTDGIKAFDFLDQSEVIPFIILCDVNLPKLDGFALRDKIKMDAKLHVKSIPYLLFTTAVSETAAMQAYSLSVQGIFIKQTKMEEIEKTIALIMEYWKRCISFDHTDEHVT